MVGFDSVARWTNSEMNTDSLSYPTIALAVLAVAILVTLLRVRARSVREREERNRAEARRMDEMISNSLDWDYNQCRDEARRILDALHPNLEFIEPETRELEHGWLFHFAIPTGNPEQPWEYLIGCDNKLFINRHTGKSEPEVADAIVTDWME